MEVIVSRSDFDNGKGSSVQSTKESDRGIEQESCTRIFRFVIYWDCQRKVEERYCQVIVGNFLFDWECFNIFAFRQKRETVNSILTPSRNFFCFI